MKQLTKQDIKDMVEARRLAREFEALRKQTGSLNEVERLNVVRKQLGMKLVLTK